MPAGMVFQQFLIFIIASEQLLQLQMRIGLADFSQVWVLKTMLIPYLIKVWGENQKGGLSSDSISSIHSGIRPGFLIGQQYNENGVAEKDRKGNPLAFDPKISDDMKETGANLEVTGIRVIKYAP